MISGNGVPTVSDRDESVPGGLRGGATGTKQSRDDGQQLRDIQDLIAKLEVVNRQLSHPLREMSTPLPADAGSAENPQP